MDITFCRLAAATAVLALSAVSPVRAQNPSGVLSADTSTVILTSAQVGAEGQLVQQSGFWVDGVDRVSQGFYRIRLSGNTFLDPPTCTATGANSPASAYFSAPPNLQVILVRMAEPGSGAAKDAAFHLICMGHAVFAL